MSDPNIDPSGNTEAFQAFARRTAAEAQVGPEKTKKLGVIIGGVATAIIVIAVVLVFALH
jgi:hypothetical protein